MKRVRLIVLYAIFVACSGQSFGYNIPPFATDTEVLQAIQGLLNLMTGTSRPNCAASPFEASTGNLFQTMPILSIPGRGPTLTLVLTYNSFDKRKGQFGSGWSSPFDQRVLKVTDGVTVSAICASQAGRRDRYARNADGSYAAPPSLNNTLIENANGTFSLREKNGTTKSFNANGKLIQITDRNGNSLTIAYDATGFMTTLTDASGRTVTFTKGADGRVAGITDPANRQFGLLYDSNGNLTKFTDPLGNAYTYQYDANGNLTKYTDPKGNVLFAASYNSDSAVLSYTERGETWTVSYNPAAKQTTKTDSSGRRWVLTYNDAGSVTKEVDPLNNAVVTRVYDANLNVPQVTDAKGNSTISTFDSKGNPLTVKDALGNTVTAIYDPNFNFPLTVTDRVGNLTTFTYDAKGNLTKVTDPLGNAAQYQYDAAGQLIKIIDALGNATTLTYDVHGRILTRANPLGQATAATYDVIGNVLSVKDANGKSTQSTFDLNQRLTKSVDPIGGTTTFQYDTSGNLTSITMPNGGVTTYEYDNLNRVQRVTNPIGKITTYAYDRKDNLTSRTDPNGVTTTYVYDAISRLTNRNGGSDPLVYTYDAVGNLLTLVNTNTTLTFVYDALNRLVQAKTSASIFQPTTTITYTYDANGQRKTMTDPANGITTYTYDAASRLTSIQDPSSQVFDFMYDKLSRRTGMTGPLSHSVAYSYDPASRLTAISDQASAGNLSFSYTHDAVGNILSKTDNTGNHVYGYDSLYRLTSAVHPPGQTTEAYAYDSIGNRVSSHLSATHSHDVANRLLSDARFAYIYDNNGNLTRKTEASSGNVTTYGYDSENRLVEVRVPQGAIYAYKYDGLNRRIAKLINGVATLSYIYDRLNILSETSGSAAPDAFYTHGNGIDEILSVRRSGAAASFQKDHLGSIVRTFSAGGVSNSSQFDSYGRITSSGGIVDSPYSFTGRERDAESGLMYYRARYYDPESGRFISEDPISFAGGNNTYAYVGANPAGLRDPSGLAAAAIAVGVGEATIACMASPPCRLAVQAAGAAAALAVAQALSNAASKAISWCSTRDDDRNFEQYIHYGYASDAPYFRGGLNPGGYATQGPIMTGPQAQEILALPNPQPPDSYYVITVPPSVPVIGPSPVQPTLDPPRTGGGIEYKFPSGTPPGSVTGPFPLPKN